MQIEKTRTTNKLNTNKKNWLYILIIFSLLVAFMLLSKQAFASDGAEFQEATNKIEGWISGQYGRLASLVALAFGAIMAAIRKDWTWLLGAVALAMGINLFLGIINSSFTATI